MDVKRTEYSKWELGGARVTQTALETKAPGFFLTVEANPLSPEQLAEVHTLLGAVLEEVPASVTPAVLDPTAGIVA